MRSYSDLVDRLLLREGFLERLIPTESYDPALTIRIREAGHEALAGTEQIGNPAAFALIRGALFYAFDAISDAHGIFQVAHGDLGAYWHGMVHRREGDFDNARYWFRRAGELAIFAELHRAVSNHCELMARQLNWDPYVFVGQCEQARYGDPDLIKEMGRVQRLEFEVLFDYTWRQSALG